MIKKKKKKILIKKEDASMDGECAVKKKKAHR